MVPLLITGSVVLAWIILNTMAAHHQQEMAVMKARTAAERAEIAAADSAGEPSR